MEPRPIFTGGYQLKPRFVLGKNINPPPPTPPQSTISTGCCLKYTKVVAQTPERPCWGYRCVVMVCNKSPRPLTSAANQTLCRPPTEWAGSF